MTRILIVDDSKFMAKGMKAILEKMDFDVCAIAHDGYEGIAEFRNHSPDVVLLDITMPNKDGLECLQEIRAMDGDARVVMLSAVHDEDVVQRCIASGAVSFLQKPIRPSSPSDLSRLQESVEEAVSKTA